jgi:3-dehydroquinate dehydratase-2
VREPHIYGSTTLAAIQASCEEFAIFASAQLSFHQSNHEGVLVDLIQSARENADAIIINPAGYSFTSIAILDALKAFEGPIFEVHISNIHARDELHRHSKLSSVVKAVIAGLGPYGYIVAMQAALAHCPKACPSLCASVRVEECPSDSLNHRSDPLSDANAHGAQCVTRLLPLQLAHSS